MSCKDCKTLARVRYDKRALETELYELRTKYEVLSAKYELLTGDGKDEGLESKS